MQFKQIAVTRVGNQNDNSGYSIVIFALSEDGQIYAGTSHAGNLVKVEWKEVKHPQVAK